MEIWRKIFFFCKNNTLCAFRNRFTAPTTTISFYVKLHRNSFLRTYNNTNIVWQKFALWRIISPSSSFNTIIYDGVVYGYYKPPSVAFYTHKCVESRNTMLNWNIIIILFYIIRSPFHACDVFRPSLLIYRWFMCGDREHIDIT